jgi:hypothetical protein
MVLLLLFAVPYPSTLDKACVQILVAVVLCTSPVEKALSSPEEEEAESRNDDPLALQLESLFVHLELDCERMLE